MAASTAATQILLADYIDTLASLPNELTRSFSDLRELDAVLRSELLVTLIHCSSILADNPPV